MASKAKARKAGSKTKKGAAKAAPKKRAAKKASPKKKSAAKAKKKAAKKAAAKPKKKATKKAAVKKKPAKKKAEKKAPAKKKPAKKVPAKKAPPAKKAKSKTVAEKARTRKTKRAPEPVVERDPLLEAEERKKAAEEERKRRALMYKRAKVSKSYQPTEKEPFMNAKQLGYFKNKLLDWRNELLRESTQTLAHLQETSLAEPDLADRASAESDRSLELRTRDRERKLISKIDAALERILDGSYGYCEETDEPIGLKRLEARPIATLSIEAQERHERRERVYRDE